MTHKIFRLLLIAAVCVGFHFLVVGDWLGWDDAFITYRYASRLAAGHGFEWNIGEPPVVGTTSYVYTMLLAALARLSISLPWASIVIGLIAKSACVYLAGRIAQRAVPESRVAFLAAGAFVMFDVFGTVGTVGMETYTFIAMVLATVYAYQRERFVWTAAWGTLGVMVRPDGILLVPILLLHYVIHYRSNVSRREVLTAAAVSVTLLLAWIIPMTELCGTFLPNSLAAKRAQTDVGLIGGFTLEGLRWLLGGWPFLLGTVGIVALVADRFRGVQSILVVWAYAQYGAYIYSGLPGFTWYLVPGIVAVMIAVACTPHRVLRAIMIPAAAVIMIGLSVRAMRHYDLWTVDGFKHLYESAGTIHAAARISPVSVATDAIGIIGYYNLDVPVHDIAGIASPQYIEALRAGRLLEMLKTNPPTFIDIPIMSMNLSPMQKQLLEKRWIFSHYAACGGGTLRILFINRKTLSMYERFIVPNK